MSEVVSADDLAQWLKPHLDKMNRKQGHRYEALVGARQKVVMRAEEARLAREADLKTLENLNAQLAEAEDRQAHYQWRQRDDPSRGDQTRGLAAAGSHRDEGDAVPKDPFERAQDLLLSLRVDVETLRSEEAMFGDKTETGVEGGGAGTDHSRAVQEAREEMTKLAARLENKKGRLESAYVDRDATRAEYQHWETNGRRSALKESLAWLEHATLQLAGT